MNILQRHNKIPGEINKYRNCQYEKPNLFYLSICRKKAFKETKTLDHKWQKIVPTSNLQ